jgi:hypothetical protein
MKIKSSSIHGFWLLLGLFLIILGFLSVDSPAKTRMRKHDERIVQEMVNLENGINNFYVQNKKLPELSEIKANLNYHFYSFEMMNFLETGKIIYNINSSSTTKFEICGTFLTSNNTKDDSYYRDYNGQYGGLNFSHDVGNKCFDREIQPWVMEQIKQEFK